MSPTGQVSPPLFTAVALGATVTADLCWGEPPATLHPVVWMGKLIGALERHAPERGEAARFAYGALIMGATLAAFVLPALLLERALRRLGLLGAVLLGLALKPAFAVRMLLATTARVERALAQDDLPAARAALRSLVSRDTSALSPALLAAAAIESVAENLSDSVMAPLLAFVVAGLPGAYAYRAANTLDAMIGYRGAPYEHLGKPAARLDDLLNLLPARLTGLLLALAAPIAHGHPGSAWRVMRRDHTMTASPNAGWPMSAAAGALGVTLEKVGHYRLSPAGRLPTAADIGRALALTRAALTLGGVSVALLLWTGERVSRRQSSACQPVGESSHAA
jgi:adenosylcobinamide-phosphate synthase